MRKVAVQTTKLLPIDLSEITLASYLKYVEQEFNVTVSSIENITPTSAEISFTGAEEHINNLLYRELELGHEDYDELEKAIDSIEDKEPPLWTIITFHDYLIQGGWVRDEMKEQLSNPLMYMRPRIYIKTLDGKTCRIRVDGTTTEPEINIDITENDEYFAGIDLVPSPNGHYNKTSSNAGSSAQFRQAIEYVDSMMET